MASLGIDFTDNLGQGMGSDMAATGGRRALLECGLRWLGEDEGSWPPNRERGYNLRAKLGENISDVESIRQGIEAEWMKDERVRSAQVSIRWRPSTREMFIDTKLEDATGPFRFVMRASELTLEVLSGVIDTSLGVS